MSDEQTYSDDEFQEDGRNSPLKPKLSNAALDEEDYAVDVALSPQDDGDYDDDTLAASVSTPGLLQAPDDKLDTLYDVNDFADGDESYNDNDFTNSIDLTAPAKHPAPDLQAGKEDALVVETNNSEVPLPPTIQTPPTPQSEAPTNMQFDQLPNPDADPSIETPSEEEKLQEAPATPVKPDDEATTDHAEVESTRIETTASDPEEISPNSETQPVDLQQNQDNPPEVQDSAIVEVEHGPLVAQSSDSTPETTLVVDPNSFSALESTKTNFEDEQPSTDMESPSQLDCESSNNDDVEIAQDAALPSSEPEVAVETQDEATSLESTNPSRRDSSHERQEMASDVQLQVMQSVDFVEPGIETAPQLDSEVQPESPSQEPQLRSEEWTSPREFKHLDTTTSESNQSRAENPLSSICGGDPPSELVVPNQAAVESQEDEILLACPSVFEDDAIMAGIGPRTCFNFAQSSRTAFDPAMSPSHSDGIASPPTCTNKSTTVTPPSGAGPPRKSVSSVSDDAAVVAPKESKLKQRLPPKTQPPSTRKPPQDDPKDPMDSSGGETPRQPLPSDIPMVFHSPQKDYRPWRPDKPTPRRPSPSKSKQTVTSPPKFHFEPKIDKMKEEWLLLNMFRQGDASKYQSFCSFQKAASTTTTAAAMSARPSSADRSRSGGGGGGGLGPYHRHGRRRLVSPKRKHEMQAQLERERNWVDGSSQSTTIPPYDSILDKYCHTITHPVVQKQIYHAVDLSPQLAYVLEKRVQAQRQAELAFLVQESPLPPPASSYAKKTNAARPPVKPTPPRKLDKMADNTIVSIKWSTPSKR